MLSYLRTPTRIVFGERIKCYFLFSEIDLEDILAANTERKYKLVFNLCYNYSVLHICYDQYLRQVFLTQHDFNQSLLIFYFCFSLLLMLCCCIICKFFFNETPLNGFNTIDKQSSISDLITFFFYKPMPFFFLLLSVFNKRWLWREVKSKWFFL